MPFTDPIFCYTDNLTTEIMANLPLPKYYREFLGLNGRDIETNILKSNLQRALSAIRLTDVPYMFTKTQNGQRRNICFHDLLWRALEDARETIIDLFECVGNREPELLDVMTELQNVIRDRRRCLICP